MDVRRNAEAATSVTAKLTNYHVERDHLKHQRHAAALFIALTVISCGQLKAFTVLRLMVCWHNLKALKFSCQSVLMFSGQILAHTCYRIHTP
jgi:hypothetical protein